MLSIASGAKTASTGSIAATSQDSSIKATEAEPSAAGMAQRKNAMQALVSLKLADSEGQGLAKAIDGLSNFLKNSMLQISYPVMLQSTYGGNPLDLATPNMKIYSGHFPEPRTHYVVDEVNKIGQRLKLYEKDMESFYVPADRQAAVQPVLSDINTLLAALDSRYAVLEKQIKIGPTLDGEVMAEKLGDMKGDLGTAQYDLKSIFEIANLRDPNSQLVNAILDLRTLRRNGYWLATTAQYLHDNARQLNPIYAIIRDAQVQGWLTLGVPTSTYPELKKDPYVPLQVKVIHRRLRDLGSYTSAVQYDLRVLSIPSDSESSVRPMLNKIHNRIQDVQSHYQKLQAMLEPGGDLNHQAVADESEAIAKDMHEVDTQCDNAAQALLKSHSVL